MALSKLQIASSLGYRRSGYGNSKQPYKQMSVKPRKLAMLPWPPVMSSRTRPSRSANISRHNSTSARPILTGSKGSFVRLRPRWPLRPGQSRQQRRVSPKHSSGPTTVLFLPRSRRLLWQLCEMRCARSSVLHQCTILDARNCFSHCNALPSSTAKACYCANRFCSSVICISGLDKVC